MSMLEEKNRLTVENTTLRRQLEEMRGRIEYSMQNSYVPPIMTNGEQVSVFFASTTVGKRGLRILCRIRSALVLKLYRKNSQLCKSANHNVE